jgi:hypothetical protein
MLLLFSYYEVLTKYRSNSTVGYSTVEREAIIFLIFDDLRDTGTVGTVLFTW